VKRFGEGSDGGVVDVDRILAWKTIFDDDQLCAHSPHPDHVPCDAPAHYVISWVDLAHKETFHPAACFRHASWYFQCALDSKWCSCAPEHRHCPSAGVRLDRLR
jgi:hypothetical protein